MVTAVDCVSWLIYKASYTKPNNTTSNTDRRYGVTLKGLLKTQNLLVGISGPLWKFSFREFLDVILQSRPAIK